MSNFLAIATVTAALRQILQAAVDVEVPGATVTTSRPEDFGSNVPATEVHIYLYQVTPNAAWRNADLPTRRSEGELVQRPQMALDLHYLLTFYGDEGRLEPERLLGSVVRILHAQPVLSRQMIRDTIANPTFAFLANSNLADAIELVKFTPISFSLEDMSKIWSVFFQIPHALSIAYQGTVVLIESDETPQEALPVRERNLYVVPFRQPVIEQVRAAGARNAPIIVGSTLLLEGRQLRADVTRIRIGGAEVTPASQDVSETEIRLQLADPPIPGDALRAGVQGIQVVHQIEMGTPLTPHSGVESNVAAFVLRPSITNIGISPTEITVTLDPPVHQTQRIVLLLNEFQPPSDRQARAYRLSDPTLNLPPGQEETNSVAFSTGGVVAGEYLVRVQIDGAQSPLEVDSDPNNPRYINPRVTVP